MIGIVAIAGQPLIRYGLHHLCAESDALKMIGEAASLRDGIRLVDDLRPDVTIVDLPRAGDRPTNHSGISALTQRDTAVLALLNPLPSAQLVDLLRNGIAGAASRNADISEIGRAVQIIGRGDLYCELSLHEPAVDMSNKHRVNGAGPRLTDKEAQVLPMITSGLTNREIAANLYISETTAKFHVANLIRKFGANRRTELAYLAAQEGLF